MKNIIVLFAQKISNMKILYFVIYVKKYFTLNAWKIGANKNKKLMKN